jgi:predicted lipoprotein with Yx(FWY)xxD motif
MSKTDEQSATNQVIRIGPLTVVLITTSEGTDMRILPWPTNGMHVNKSVRVVAVGLVVGGLATSVGVADASGASHNHAKSVVFTTLNNAKFGSILVDGRTIYTLKANATTCATKCHKIWIEVLLPKGVTKATAGSGVSANKLGTVKGVGGALQVTYAGKALFWFSKDKVGQVTGNVTDTWGKWSDVVLVKPSGKKPTTTTSTEPPKTTTTIAKTTTTTTPKSTTTTTTPRTTTTTVPGGGGGVGF